MTKDIENICFCIGMMIFECSELLDKVVITNKSLNENQKKAVSTTINSLISCCSVVNNLKVYDKQEAKKEDGKDE